MLFSFTHLLLVAIAISAKMQFSFSDTSVHAEHIVLCVSDFKFPLLKLEVLCLQLFSWSTNCHNSFLSV